MPSISKAVKKYNPQTEIYLDGGISRGTDILKALAYGARAVFINKPIIYSMMRGAKEGMNEVFAILNDEL